MEIQTGGRLERSLQTQTAPLFGLFVHHDHLPICLDVFFVCMSTPHPEMGMCVCLTVLQAHPQLFVVFLLHVIDNLALVLQGVGLLDAGHEVSLYHRAGWAVEQVPIWKILTHIHRAKIFKAR